MLGAVGLIGAAVGALGGGGGAGAAISAVAGGGGFEAALSRATSAFGLGGGADEQLQQQMIETGTGVMGGIMMRLAGEVLADGMEDDGE